MSIRREMSASSPTSPQQLPLPSFSPSAVKSSSGFQPACKISHDEDPFWDKKKRRYALESLGPIGDFVHQDSMDEQTNEDMQPSITMEGVGGTQERMPNQAIGRTHLEDNREKDPIGWHGGGSGPSVTPVVSIPSTSNLRGKKLLLKLWREEQERKEREEKGNEKDGEAGKERKTTGVYKQVDGDEESSNERTRSVNRLMNSQSEVLLSIADNVKTYPRKKGSASKEATINQKGEPKIGMKTANQMKSQSDVPLSIADSVKTHHRKKGSASKEATVNQKGKQKMGMKTSNFSLAIEYWEEQEPEEVRPKRATKKLVDENEYQGEEEQKKGRPKKVADQSVNENENGGEQNRKRVRPRKVNDHLANEHKNGEEQNRKRVRPRKVNDHLANEHKCGAEQKWKRRRPKKVTVQLANGQEYKGELKHKRRPKKNEDQLANDKYEEEPKLKKGRPKKDEDQLVNDKHEGKATRKKKRRRNLKCPYILD